ncbi:MAG TPA: hypothetical protein VMS43_02110 [Allosphingosinicella sp.]|nr:hypothetical protein [Allosphingosinicella sp.]
MKILLALGAIVSSASAVVAQAPRSSNALICRSTSDTGSRLAHRRVCRTREQWAAGQREQRQALDRAQTRQLNRTMDEVGKTR